MKKLSARKLSTKQKLMAEAKRQFVEKGFEATSIKTVMASCGLTRGGFYSYFASKQDLFNQAMAWQSELGKAKAEGVLSQDCLRNIVDMDLVAQEPGVVPLQFFSRADNVSETDLAYTQVLRTTIDVLMKYLKLDSQRGEGELLSSIAMIVGAETLSRKLCDSYLEFKVKESCEIKLGRLNRIEENFEYLWDWKSQADEREVISAEFIR